MNTNPKKVKLIIFSSIMLVMILLVAVTSSLISISVNNSNLQKQQAEIQRLENEKKYYEYLNSLDPSLEEYIVTLPGENK